MSIKLIKNLHFLKLDKNRRHPAITVDNQLKLNFCQYVSLNQCYPTETRKKNIFEQFIVTKQQKVQCFYSNLICSNNQEAFVC